MRGLTHEQRRSRRKVIAQDVANGSSMAEVCQRHKVTRHTAWSACKENGVPMLHNGCHLPPSSYRILADLLNTDDTLRDIAAKHRVTHQFVFIVLKQAKDAGITFPHRKERKRA